MPELTVVSFNLRGIHDRWWKREPLVVAGLAELDPDVVCIQEAATWCWQAHWLAWRLSRRTGVPYRVRLAPKTGFRGAFEGIAILSRLPMRWHQAISLGHGGRVAQRVEFQVGGKQLLVVNTHLAHRSAAAGAREAQARKIAGWMEPRIEPALLAGDLNSLPGSEALRALAPAFRSIHAVDGFAGTAPAWKPERIIDYILAAEAVEVVECGTFLDQPVAGVWPSDHIGLWARVRF